VKLGNNANDMSFETFTAVMFLQVEVFWVVTPCIDVVGYQRFRGPYCLHLQGEETRKGENSIDGGSMDLWNIGILPNPHTASQPRTPRL
jgi:hypothetical protein